MALLPLTTTPAKALSHSSSKSVMSRTNYMENTVTPRAVWFALFILVSVYVFDSGHLSFSSLSFVSHEGLRVLYKALYKQKEHFLPSPRSLRD